MMRLTLCTATVQEINRLIELVKAYYLFDSLNFDSFVEKAIFELVQDTRLGQAWFLMLETQIIGYAILTAGFDIEFGGQIGVVTDFYLVEEYRGRGHGRTALGLIEDAATKRGYKAIELSVTHQNPRARRLYLSQGFCPLDDRSTMIKGLAREH